MQTGQFPEGLDRLKAIEAAERKKEKNDEMIAYVGFPSGLTALEILSEVIGSRK